MTTMIFIMGGELMKTIEQLALKSGAELVPAYSEVMCNKETISFTHEQLTAFAEAYHAQKEDDKWISVDKIPDVKKGFNEEFIICVYRKHSDKKRVFSADYLNEMELDTGEDTENFTGWHIKSKHYDYDDYFEPLHLNDGDKIIGWQPLPISKDGE